MYCRIIHFYVFNFGLTERTRVCHRNVCSAMMARELMITNVAFCVISRGTASAHGSGGVRFYLIISNK